MACLRLVRLVKWMIKQTDISKANLYLVILMNGLPKFSEFGKMDHFAVVLGTIYVFQPCLSLLERSLQNFDLSLQV